MKNLLKLSVVLLITLSTFLGCEETDTEPPQIELIGPVDGSTVYEIVPITVQASDNKGIERIDFYVGANLIGTDSEEPYIYDWNTTSLEDGSFRSIQCRAYDTSENGAISPSVTVTINNEGRTPMSSLFHEQDNSKKYSITLLWQKSIESDFKSYIVHKAESILEENFWECVHSGISPNTFDENCVESWLEIYESQFQADTSFVDTSVSISRYYVYKITVQDSAGLLSESNIKYFYTRSISSIPISSLSVNDDLSVSITWNQSMESDFYKYELYRNNGQSEDELIYTTFDITTTSFTDVNTNEYDVFSYFIRHYDQNGSYRDGPSQSVSIHLSPAILRVPSETFQTIQEALDFAEPSDIILVGDGIYFENLIFPEKPNIKLKSLNGPTSTILDGSRNGTVITVNGNYTEMDTSNSIEGFTIQNAGYVSFESSPDISWSRDGGGISLKWNANILIKNNIIKDNYNSCGGGGGLYSYESSPVIVNNKFLNNVAGISPNGEYCGNWYGGALCLYYGEPIVRNCIFSNNQAQHEGGALYIYNTTDISLENCVFFNNDLIGDYDTGSLLQCNDHGNDSYSLRFTNCIFWESNSDPFSNRYGGVSIEMSYSDYDLTDSDVSYLEGNISNNPLFLDEIDFLINESSPAHDTGNPDSRYNDLDGSRNDMGAYGGLWGAW